MCSDSILGVTHKFMITNTAVVDLALISLYFAPICTFSDALDKNYRPYTLHTHICWHHA